MRLVAELDEHRSRILMSTILDTLGEILDVVGDVLDLLTDSGPVDSSEEVLHRGQR